MFVAIFLIAIMAVGAVSATEDIRENDVKKDDVVGDVASEEPIASDDKEDSLSDNVDDGVYIDIENEVRINEKDPQVGDVWDSKGLNGTITVYVDGNLSYSKKISYNPQEQDCPIYLSNLTLPKGFSQGNHIVNITYLKNDVKYLSIQKTVDFTYYFDLYAQGDTYGENMRVFISVPEDATNTVTFIFNGKTYTAKPDENGQVRFLIPLTFLGNYTLYATYNGDSKYPAKTINQTKTIKPNIYHMFDESISVGENQFISINIPADATGEVFIYSVDQDSGNKTLVATVPVSGSADIYSLKSLAKGNYEFYINYTIAGVEGEEYGVDINVKENTPGFSASVSSNSITAGDNIDVTFNSPIDTADFVWITVDNNAMKFIKISNRMVSEVISGLDVGTHKINVRYSDNVNFYSNTFTVEVKNKPAPPVSPTVTLSLSTAKVKKSAKKLVLKAKLLIDNKAVSGKIIKFKFNGKTYKAKTDKKGIAKATIKHSVLKKLKVGKKVKYSASYENKSVQKTAKVKK